MRRIIKCSLLLLALLFFSALLRAQHQASSWYFGNGASLTFRTDPPSPLAPIPSLAGSYSDRLSAVSDSDGNLLFVTDGDKVFNKTGEVMENGEIRPNLGAMYNTIVVPKPGHDAVYFVFTISQHGNPIYLNYAEVDMNQGNGLGRVTSKRNELMSVATRKLAAVSHCNGKDVWLLTNGAGTNRYYAFLVSDTGVCPRPVVSSAGLPLSGYPGDMKFSPDGTKLATVEMFHDTQVLNFDSNSGRVSAGLTIPKDLFGTEKFYVSYYQSASFSPDNTKLYVSSGDWHAEDGSCAKLSQFDLEAPDVAKSHYRVYDNDGATPGPGGCRSEGVGDIQIGPDGKMYIANHDRYYLHVINNPDAKGPDLNFVLDGVYLGGGRSSWRLPNFVESYFNKTGLPVGCPSASGDVTFSFQQTCFSQYTSFAVDFAGNGPYAVEWDFGDPQSLEHNVSAELNPAHRFSSPGTYQVRLSLYSLYDCSKAESVTKTVTILPAVPIELGPDRVLCGNDGITLDASTASALSYRWSDGSTGPTLEVREPGRYWVEVNQGECTLRDSVLISRVSEITASIGKDTVLCAGESLYLDATSPGATYRWSNGSQQPVLFVSAPGTYGVTITNACYTSTQSVTVDVVDCKDPTPGYRKCGELSRDTLPNVFTPNSDGKNDFFGVSETANLAGYSLEIYDRWGKKVFGSSKDNTVWKGERAASGVYFYLMRFQCGEGKRVVSKAIKGSVTLMR